MARDKKTAAGAMNLVASGISVRRNERADNNLRNVSFHCRFPGILKMPVLHVDESSAYLFLNLIAMEYCPGFKIEDYSKTVRSCLGFFAYLIQTPEDVKELRIRGMLKNNLKSDAHVALLFRQMGNDMEPDNDIRYHVIENINSYCNSWLANYFGSQWSIVTFVGAMSGLVMTLVQTYFSLLKKEMKTD
ncbi:hypothetical protein V6N13_026164 [Hibiscus sabdariffa]|uniref:Transmembrane protein n=1 Tax=Hibiscus sabdariffa TaxID=183260 RepID=A0ABR2P5G8_9ROSI